VTYSPCLKAGASAVNAGCRAFRRDFHRLRQYEMMPHLKTQTLLVEYFTWQPICHNRLYSVVKVPRLAQLPGFTPRAMRQLNEWKYSANGFKLQDFLRLISPYLKLGALRRFSVTALRTGYFVNTFVIPRDLSYVTGANGGFKLAPKRARQPDVGFISKVSPAGTAERIQNRA